MRLPGKLRSLHKDQNGIAAVEFAMILPLMISLFFGLVELSLALSCRADVTNVASTAADLTAQESAVTTSDMTNIFNAAGAILYPYNTTAARVTVTSLIDNGSPGLTQGKVAWSCTRNGTARGKNSVVSLPSGLMTTGGSVIMSEITYSYASPTTKIITGPVSMTDTFYTKPRRVAQIAGPTPACQ